jgi:methylated-DNA-[protein]-cysteine S-methyltransferase
MLDITGGCVCGQLRYEALIPCHRVLAAGGKIGGFSAPGGSAAKIRMLALEGVDLEPPRPAQQSLGF